MVNKVKCPVCAGEGGSYDYCGEDYGAMWLVCTECDGAGKIEADGVALNSISHPPGLIDNLAAAIRDGRLSLKR